MFRQNQFNLFGTKTFIVQSEIKPHSFRPCFVERRSKVFFFSMALWIRIFFFPISKFLSFCRRRNGKKKGSFSSFFLLFSFWERRQKEQIPFPFSPLFPFLLFLFSFFSLFFSILEQEMGEKRKRIFSSFLLFKFLICEKKQGSNWKKSKEILPLFRSFFLYFFFLFSLLIFSFWERK